MSQRFHRFMPGIAFACLLFLASSAGIFAQESGPDESPHAPPWEQVAPKSYWRDQAPPGAGTNVYQMQQAMRVALANLGPQPVENWSRVVFQAATPDGGWDIFSMRVDGSDLRRLTNHPASDTSPRLNSQQTEVVFTSYRDGNAEIYKVPADGSAAPQRLTDNPAADAWPNWSLSGGVVFASSRDGQFDLYTMGADGSNVTKILEDRSSHDILPFYDANTHQLLYVRYWAEGAAVYRMGTPNQALTPTMPEVDDPWLIKDPLSQNSMVFSGDIDKDGAYELIFCGMANCGPNVFPARPAKVLMDANSPNEDVLAGPPAPRTPAYLRPSDPFKFMFLRRRFHKDGDQTITDSLTAHVAEVKNLSTQPLNPDWEIQGASDLPNFNWTYPAAWILDDTAGPVLSIGALPEYNFVSYNSAEQDIVLETPIDGYDPGGSGIVQFRWEIEGQGASGFRSWEKIQNDRIFVHVGSFPEREIRFRLQGQDWNFNTGPWSDWKTAKLYTGYLYGQAQDAHGRPIPQPRIVKYPPQAWPDVSAGDTLGRFALRTTASGPMELAHDGYGTGRVFAFDLVYTNTLAGQTPTVIHLPPKEAVFTNGEFTTDSLSDWTISGSTSVVRAGTQSSGDTLLILGPPDWNTIYLSGVTRLEKVLDLRSLYKPVLGLAYMDSLSQGKLEVDLEAGGVITPLLQSESASTTLQEEMVLSKGQYFLPSSPGAEDVFFDLTPWATGVVTLSLNLQGDASNYLRGHVYFDRISLGSWTTPVLTSLQISTTTSVTSTTPTTTSLRLGTAASVTRTLIIAG
ncbi:MAG: hypothetical protein D6790_13505, partial [Caldilineae bacterium]